MFYCLSAYLSVEETAREMFGIQAVPVPSMVVPVCCREMCILSEQMESSLSGHAKPQTLALSRVHGALQTYQRCIVALGQHLQVARHSGMDIDRIVG